ncbi:hypothetical protein 12VC501_gene0066 [Vibrio phage 12VC501]|nr:hypothetical protein 12VC501_gene0066 [Vibrio phage 12VC501]
MKLIKTDVEIVSSCVVSFSLQMTYPFEYEMGKDNFVLEFKYVPDQN